MMSHTDACKESRKRWSELSLAALYFFLCLKSAVHIYTCLIWLTFKLICIFQTCCGLFWSLFLHWVLNCFVCDLFQGILRIFLRWSGYLQFCDLFCMSGLYFWLLNSIILRQCCLIWETLSNDEFEHFNVIIEA